ncbi:unnamed protein product [Effrenium voratum]|nr:unnamed protein product [Effrenium voratum]
MVNPPKHQARALVEGCGLVGARRGIRLKWNKHCAKAHVDNSPTSCPKQVITPAVQTQYRRYLCATRLCSTQGSGSRVATGFTNRTKESYVSLVKPPNVKPARWLQKVSSGRKGLYQRTGWED